MNIYTCPLCRYDFKEALPWLGRQLHVPEILEESTFIVLNMDLYDFVLELLWQRYQLE